MTDYDGHDTSEVKEYHRKEQLITEECKSIWKLVYVAAIQLGKTDEKAKERADMAARLWKETFHKS
jgi:hypothetical protein